MSRNCLLHLAHHTFTQECEVWWRDFVRQRRRDGQPDEQITASWDAAYERVSASLAGRDACPDEQAIRADERARIAAYLRSLMADFPTANTWLNSHRINVTAGPAPVIRAAARDIEKGVHLEQP